MYVFLFCQAKSLGVAPGEGDAADSVTSFLLRAMDPPHQLSVHNAVSALQVCFFFLLVRTVVFLNCAVLL